MFSNLGFLFNECVCATHQRLLTDLRPVFGLSSLEGSAGPQFDSIKWNPFTLGLACGRLPFSLNNNVPLRSTEHKTKQRKRLLDDIRRRRLEATRGRPGLSCCSCPCPVLSRNPLQQLRGRRRAACRRSGALLGHSRSSRPQLLLDVHFPLAPSACFLGYRDA